MSISVNLCITLEGETYTALSIPRVEFANFTRRPLKWLRYLAFVIYGIKGRLSETVGGDEVDYNYPNVEGLEANYYYIPDIESTKCLIDADGIETTSINSEQSGNFVDQITERDGACVMTRSHRIDCDCCHLIPSIKSNEYIKTITKLRGNGVVIDSISDVRNGLMLFCSLYEAVRNHRAAFLKTPNFAMETEDVQISTPYWCGQDNGAPRPPALPSDSGSQTPVYVIQYFPQLHPSRVELLERACPRNAYTLLDFKNGNVESEHKPPSDTILDFSYGLAALKTWGSEEFLVRMKKYNQSVYRASNPEDDASWLATTSGSTSAEDSDVLDALHGIRLQATHDQSAIIENERMERSVSKVSNWRLNGSI